MVEPGNSLGADSVKRDRLSTGAAFRLWHIQPARCGLGHHCRPGRLGHTCARTGKMDAAARLVWTVGITLPVLYPFPIMQYVAGATYCVLFNSKRSAMDLG